MSLGSDKIEFHPCEQGSIETDERLRFNGRERAATNSPPLNITT